MAENKGTNIQPKKEEPKQTPQPKELTVKDYIAQKKELQKQLEELSKKAIDTEAVKARRSLLKSIAIACANGLDDGFITPELVVFAKTHMSDATKKRFEQRASEYKKKYALDFMDYIDL